MSECCRDSHWSIALICFVVKIISDNLLRDLFISCSAAFDRIAEINFNIDADDHSVSAWKHHSLFKWSLNPVVSVCFDALLLYGLLCSCRPMLQLLRRVVKKESSSSMTVRKRRIFGMKKKLTMQHKSNPDRGTEHSWYAWGNRFGCFVYWIHILYLFFPGLGCLFLQIIHPRVPWGMGVEAAGRPLRKRMLRKRPVLSSLQQLRLRVSATTSPTTLNFSAEFIR